MRFISIILSLAILLAVVLSVRSVSARPAVPDNHEQIVLSFAPLVRAASPAVVNVFTRKAVRSRGPVPSLFNDPFFRRFFGESFGETQPRERFENSLGSGVIVRPDGLIVTNFHVIRGADSITVVLSDRREFRAIILREDERTDLAILKIDADTEDLPHIALSDSDDLEVGDLVLAIGNPFGVGKTVTSGIVSGLARTQVGVSDFNFFIQTDAAINPGNSGGALLRMDGTLAGINTAIFSRSGGSQGIGFAIPSNMVRTVIDGAAAGEALRRAWIGAAFDTVTADIAEAIGLSRPEGVILSAIHPDGPAAKAGLESGDIVTAINGLPVFNTEGLRFRIATSVIGEEARLSVRRTEAQLEVALVLEDPPEVPPRNEQVLEGRHPIAGATVANLSPAVAEEMGRDHFEEGVIIRSIIRGSPAHRLSFQVGDVIFAINGSQIETVRRIRELTAKSVPQWTITVRRDGRLFSLTVGG
ncbi:MAG: serine protease [Alphaproteobacteria bacterium]|nr:serine protease [Alphaproteobacteria bacterium]HCP01432.1 serine protease [Rhodospirillaceae bacterium]